MTDVRIFLQEGTTQARDGRIRWRQPKQKAKASTVLAVKDYLRSASSEPYQPDPTRRTWLHFRVWFVDCATASEGRVLIESVGQAAVAGTMPVTTGGAVPGYDNSYYLGDTALEALRTAIPRIRDWDKILAAKGKISNSFNNL